MQIQRFLPYAVLTLLMVFVPLFLCASSAGRIAGTVVDEGTGGPLFGVSVTIDGTTRGATTDIDGEFVITGVPPGIYTLIISSIGYEVLSVPDIRVNVDQVTEVDIKLRKLELETGQMSPATGKRKEIDRDQSRTMSNANGKVITVAPVASIDELPAGETGTSSDAESKSEVRGDQGDLKMYQFSSPQSVEPRDKAGDRSGMCPQSIVRKPRPMYPQPPPPCPPWPPYIHHDPFDDMFFQNYGVNPFIDTEDDHLSTFAADVDDASYIMMRSYLDRGQLPPTDAIRVEEFVNHFRYDYGAPDDEPFAVFLEGAPSRFSRNSYLLHIGIKAKDVADWQRKPANLVLLVDVSGSMERERRLELVKDALEYLVDQMEEDDRIGIVTFNTSARYVLPMTSAYRRSDIFRAIHGLYPGGSTNVDDGLRLAYRMAERNFHEGRINHIILCSDGVANTGVTHPDDLLSRIKRYADMGITLSTVGVGMGNYNDVLLEKLGDKGNGNYAYVDDREEARRVFVDKLTGTLQVVARDVKLQVDFDPEVVRSYRLLGYENRDVADYKFRDNREDGGEIGAGHEVTALYEIKFRNGLHFGQLGTIDIRYKDADGHRVTELTFPISQEVICRGFKNSSPQFRLAAAAAEFSEILRKSYWARGSSLYAVRDLARDVYDDWRTPEIAEFVQLVERAARLSEDHAER